MSPLPRVLNGNIPSPRMPPIHLWAKDYIGIYILTSINIHGSKLLSMLIYLHMKHTKVMSFKYIVLKQFSLTTDCKTIGQALLLHTGIFI